MPGIFILLMFLILFCFRDSGHIQFTYSTFPDFSGVCKVLLCVFCVCIL